MTTILVLCAIASNVCGVRASQKQPVLSCAGGDCDLSRDSSNIHKQLAPEAATVLLQSRARISQDKPHTEELLSKRYSYIKIEDDESLGRHNRVSSKKGITPVLVLKQSHSGSSWFTQLLQAAPDIYLQREGITNWYLCKLKGNPNATVEHLANYANEALSRPRGQFWSQDVLAENEKYPEATQECLKHFDNCTMPVTGFTMEMTEDITLNYKAFFKMITDAHQDVKVVIYRRSNLVKRALGQGGSDSDQDPIYEPTRNANLISKDEDPSSVIAKGAGPLGKLPMSQMPPFIDMATLSPEGLLDRLSIAVNQDRELLQLRDIFPDAVVLNYEELQNDVAPPVNSVLRALGIPYYLKAVEHQAEDPKKSDEALSKHFDQATWTSMVGALQKWYPSAVKMLQSEVSGVVFDPILEPDCRPECLE